MKLNINKCENNHVSKIFQFEAVEFEAVVADWQTKYPFAWYPFLHSKQVTISRTLVKRLHPSIGDFSQFDVIWLTA